MPLEVIVRPPPAVHILLRNSASILQRAELIGGWPINSARLHETLQSRNNPLPYRSDRRLSDLSNESMEEKS